MSEAYNPGLGPQAAETEPKPQAAEVKIYKDGSTMEVHRDGSFSPGELAQRASEPLRRDQGGSIFVQTEYLDGDNVKQIRRFYFDGDSCVYRRGKGLDDLKGVRLPAGYLDDSKHQLTVGEQWESPFGRTRGVVVAVGEAYADALLDPTAPEHQVNYPTSPVMRGRELLDRVPPTAVVGTPL